MSCESSIEDIFLTWLNVFYPVNWKTTPRLIRRLKTARQKLRFPPGDILIQKNIIFEISWQKISSSLCKRQYSLINIKRHKWVRKYYVDIFKIWNLTKSSSSTQKLGQFQRQSRHFDWLLRTGTHDLQIKFR